MTHCNNSFVGRAPEVRALRAALDARSRLVTITGSAGIGKTRLAKEVAGIDGGQRWYLCDLAEATTIDAACAVVARTIASPIAAAATTDDSVLQLARAFDALGDVVVLLDNVEQLVDVCPRLLAPWLADAPRATFVATSRERLRLDDEVVIGLEPLQTSEGVELFLDRARRVRFDLAPSSEHLPTLEALVTRLDGIPLAIELCASRVGLLSLDQILSKLSLRFDLLARGSRGAPARRATLRGALDWSWDLLCGPERSVLAQCSVFRGSFTLEAAEAVLDVEDAAGPLDLLQSLHDKSLLRAFDASTADGACAERRYRLLESVREYAALRLRETDQTTAAIERHAAFFLRGAGDANDVVTARRIRTLAPDADNLLSICRRHAESAPFTAHDAGVMLRALLVLEPVLLLSGAGRLEPYVLMLDRALALEPRPADLAVFARALYTRGLADLARGLFGEAFQALERCVLASRDAGAGSTEARALTKLGIMAGYAGRFAEASAYFDSARPIVLELDHPALSADWMLSSATASMARGRPHDAVESAEQAVAAYERLGDVRGRATALAQAALALVSIGRAEGAQDAATQSLAALDQTEDYRTRAYALAAAGRARHMQGRFAEAREWLSDSLTIHRAIGDRWCEGVTTGYLADVLLEEGRFDEARTLYTEASRTLDGTAERHYRVTFLASLGVASAELGRADAAAASLVRAMDGSLEQEGLVNARVLLELRRAHVEILCASSDEPAGPERQAQAAIALARAPGQDGGPGATECSEDVRFALRMLERALLRVSRPISSAPPPASSPSLVVGPEARWFRSTNLAPVHLPRSRALRLVLVALTRERIRAPGRALSCQQLVAAGWPGERIQPRAAANRLYVTLTKLRRLGLADVLQSRDDGFLLDPSRIVLESAA